MSNYSLDFTKSKRGIMPVKYLEADEETGKPQTRTLIVKTPTKKVMDALFNVRNMPEGDEEEQIDMIYSLAKECMDNNLNGIKVSRDWLDSHFSISDLIEFVSTYTKFVEEAASAPN